MEKYFMQTFEYEKNKYFNSTLVTNNFTKVDNVQILELINSLDAVINFIVTSNPSNPIDKFHSSAENYLNQLLGIFEQKTMGEPELNSVLKIIHSNSIQLAEKYIDNKTSDKDLITKKNIVRSNQYKDNLASFKEAGFLEYEFALDSEFLTWCDNQLFNARKKYENESDWRGANAYENNSSEFKFIENFIHKNQILDVISDYKQMNMEMLYAAWDYSHSRQKWFRHNHEYDYISPTNYYHFDADEDVAKMLIYLSDVSLEDGPFKFVKGSNAMSRSPFLTFIHYSIDDKISRQYAQKDNLYGRGLFLYRKDLLMKFPASIRGTTHFGDDLIENSLLSKYLLENTITFTKKKGTAVLFDGFKGVHAGGNAADGERLAVQVAFRRKSSPAQKNTEQNRIVRKLKSLIR